MIKHLKMNINIENMNILQLCLLNLLFHALFGERFDAFFDYTKQYEWPSLCLTGKKQSPIRSNVKTEKT